MEGKKQFPCGICKKVCKSKGGLTKHQQSKHAEQLGESSSSSMLAENVVSVENIRTTRRLHRRSLRLPTRRKWAQSGYLCTMPSTAQARVDAGFLGLKVGGGLNLQMWDLNRAHETERIVFPILIGFQHV